MFAAIRAKLVDDAKNAWKWLSIQFGVLAAAIDGFQESIKQGWISLPDDVKAGMGTWAPRAIGVCVLIAIFGRLYKQKTSAPPSESH